MADIKEDDLLLCKWLLGKIVEVFFDNDRRVRIAKVKIPNGVFIKSISKLSHDFVKIN